MGLEHKDTVNGVERQGYQWFGLSQRLNGKDIVPGVAPQGHCPRSCTARTLSQGLHGKDIVPGVGRHGHCPRGWNARTLSQGAGIQVRLD